MILYSTLVNEVFSVSAYMYYRIIKSFMLPPFVCSEMG